MTSGPTVLGACPCCATRRGFLASSALAALALSGASAPAAAAGASLSPPPPNATGDRIADAIAPYYRAYRTRLLPQADLVTWVQVDLGERRAFDAVKLYPSSAHLLQGDGFPLRFRIECSDDPAFHTKRVLADKTRRDYPDTHNHIVQFAAEGAEARYVRLTVTRLRQQKTPSIFYTLAHAMWAPIEQQLGALHLFALSKLEVLSGGQDLALQCPVVVDPAHGDEGCAAQLTRAARPQGEYLVTDNPGNVTEPSAWTRVSDRAAAPVGGVALQDGLFRRALENNINYLLNSYSTDDLLRQFRQRAGRAVAPAVNPSPFAGFWEDDLAGSNAGRFLMAAGQALHWTEHDELRARMNAVVEGIAQCRQANGYIMAYLEDTFFVSERGAYTRAWVTHGLIEAGYAGNATAFELLRGYYDWYNQQAFLPEALRGCNQGGQGMIANARLYFTPVGRPADLQVLQRYFQENYWLDALAARQADAIWQYPYDRPHVYLLTNVEAYGDLYRATGDRKYLAAVEGAWELFRTNWQNVGGSFSLKELQPNVPRSNPLYDTLGETCGSAFWIFLNQRLHQLNPDNEAYVAEIEKSIFNVILANQDGAAGIRYHTMLVGRKEGAHRVNTCCEAQGARALAGLAQHIYSIADDGVYVNLFEASTLEWTHAGRALSLRMETEFPRAPGVRICVTAAQPVRAKLRIRVPGWAAAEMDVKVNGRRAARGVPGRYVAIERRWVSGDVISFELPIEFRLTKYEGVDQIAGRDRFMLEYGPILMAALGAADSELVVRMAESPMDLATRLEPVAGQPLHFALSAYMGGAEFIPYFEVNEQFFSCAPIIEARTDAL